MKSVKKKLTNFIRLIKDNKQTKVLSIAFVLILFVFSVGYALSYFNVSNNKKFANITVNDLSFNMTTNSGASDDRVLHLKPSKTESFSIVLTNLNKMDVKYELIYSYCDDSNCSNPTETKIDDIMVDVMEDSLNVINGTISPGTANKKVINIFTQNYSSNDVYIKLNLNAGYTWNELELVDQFHLDSVNAGFNTQMDIVAYVDGVETTAFPDSCNYIAKIRGYNDSSEIVMGDSSLTCDREKNTWKLVLEGLVKKVVIQFIYVPGVPTFTYTGNYEIVNGDTADWKIRLLSSGTLTFTDQNPTIDIFIVGGGGNGATGSDYWATSAGGSSGGGGAAITVKSFPTTKATGYGIVIGNNLANSSFGLGGTAYYTALAGGTGAACEYPNSGTYTGAAGSAGAGRLSGQTGNYGAKSVVARAGASGNGQAGNYEFDEEGNTRYGASGGYGGGGVSSYTGGYGAAGSAGGTNGGGAGGKGCSYVNNGGWAFINAVSGGAGSANSGSGGGGGGGRCGANTTSYGGAAGSGGAGASGIVIIRATKDV